MPLILVLRVKDGNRAREMSRKRRDATTSSTTCIGCLVADAGRAVAKRKLKESAFESNYNKMGFLWHVINRLDDESL